MDETKEAAATPTPWRHLVDLAAIYGANNAIVACLAGHWDHPQVLCDAAHIVRCVNAWDDAELLRSRVAEIEGEDSFRLMREDRDYLLRAHDELVAALRSLMNAEAIYDDDHPALIHARISAHAALAKAGAA